MSSALLAAPSRIPVQPARLPRRFDTREQQLKSLMLAGLGGDKRSHTGLLRAARPLLAAFYYRRIGYCAEAEDLVQEALIAVHERSKAYDPDRPIMPWLFAIARYKLVDHFRRARSEEQLCGNEHFIAEESFEGALIARLDVAALLRTLPPKQAGAIRRTRLRELSVAEAAREAGLGESDVKVSAFRGIRSLTERVARAALQ